MKAGVERTGAGLEPPVGGLLAWSIPPISGLVILLVEADRPVVRWHAAQSIVFGIVWILVGVVLYVVVMAMVLLGAAAGAMADADPTAVVLFAPVLYALYMLASVVIWVVCLIKGASGEAWRFPLIARFAERIVPPPE